MTPEVVEDAERPRGRGHRWSVTAAWVLGLTLTTTAVGWWAVPKAVHWAVTHQIAAEATPAFTETVDPKELTGAVNAAGQALNDLRYQLDTRQVPSATALRDASRALHEYMPKGRPDAERLNRTRALMDAVDRALMELVRPDGDGNRVLQLTMAAEQRVAPAQQELIRLARAMGVDR